LAASLCWRARCASPTERIRSGIAANHAYVAAVEAARPIGEIEAARRAAGLASTEAEVALHDLGTTVRRFHVSSEDRASIAALRRLAGDAAIAWHRRLAAAKAPPEESC
jgi:DNA-binding FadR family transcriptional regulator